MLVHTSVAIGVGAAAPPRPDRSVSTTSPLAATTSGSGSKPSGLATATCMPSAPAAAIREWQTLLQPSPTQASLRPSSEPSRSRRVSTSASAWQGWWRSVRPLMTGHVGGVGQLARPRCVGSGADHDRVHVARQHDAGVLDRLAAAELHVGRRQVDSGAAQLGDAHLERDAGAGGRLLKDHRQRAARQQPVLGTPLACSSFSRSARSSSVEQLGGRQRVDREQVAAGQRRRGRVGEHRHGCKSMPQMCMNMRSLDCGRAPDRASHRPP